MGAPPNLLYSFINCRDRRPRLSVFMQMLPYDKGLLIHRKRSPQRLPTANLIRSEAECSPDKGRLVGIVCASDDLLIIVYKQIKMHRTTKRVTLSLPLSGKGDHEVVDE